jgi:hypothetical protein
MRLRRRKDHAAARDGGVPRDYDLSLRAIDRAGLFFGKTKRIGARQFTTARRLIDIRANDTIGHDTNARQQITPAR